MTQVDHRRTGQVPGPTTTNLADILERVLDKGIVIAGDIKIDLLDIELLTIRLRLFVASVDTAKKAGIDWWETDPALSSRAAHQELLEENRLLRERLAAPRSTEAAGLPGGGTDAPYGDDEAYEDDEDFEDDEDYVGDDHDDHGDHDDRDGRPGGRDRRAEEGPLA
ncbi:gas vesicle protein [Streptomyces sp. ATE26]|uniref:gas vesicle protein n=1 Tax=Streptomyces sp. ATE26 TaxID=2954237 RepID=UPI002482B683|nr:gas vesicle protein [Streptomyces sp. ATE26]MDI1454962.1 gas vesicle protein [Streptomyces sp. ATE26]